MAGVGLFSLPGARGDSPTFTWAKYWAAGAGGIEIWVGILPGPNRSWVFRMIWEAASGGVIVTSGVVGEGFPAGAYSTNEPPGLPVETVRSTHSPATSIFRPPLASPPMFLNRVRSEEDTSELQSRQYLVCRPLL